MTFEHSITRPISFQLLNSSNGAVIEEQSVWQAIGTIRHAEFSADESALVFAGDREIGYWSLSEKKFSLIHEATSGTIEAMVTSHDGTLIATSGTDGYVIVWKYGEASPYKQVAAGAGKKITSLYFLQGTSTLCFSADGQIYRWDFETGNAPQLLITTTLLSNVQYIGLSANNDHELQVVSDSFYTYHFSSQTYTSHGPVPAATHSGHFDQGSGRLFLTSFQRLLFVVDLNTFSVENKGDIFESDLRVEGFMGSEKILLRVNMHSIGLYDIPKKHFLPLFLPISDISWARYDAAEDNIIISSGLRSPGEILVLNRANGSIAGLWKTVDEGIVSFALSSSANRLLVAGKSHELTLWNYPQGTLDKKLNVDSVPATVPIIQCEMTPDGKYAAVLFADTAIRMWDIHSSSLIATIKPRSAVHFMAVRDSLLAFDAGGDLVFASLRSGVPIDTFSHLGSSGHIQFLTDSVVWIELGIWYNIVTKSHMFAEAGGILARDQQYAFSTWYGLPITVNDVKTGKAVYTYEEYDNDFRFLFPSADGRTLIAASQDELVLLKHHFYPSKVVSGERSIPWVLNSQINPSYVYTRTQGPLSVSAVSIYNSLGTLITTYQPYLADGVILLNSAHLHSGLYYLEVESANLKFLIVR